MTILCKISKNNSDDRIDRFFDGDSDKRRE